MHTLVSVHAYEIQTLRAKVIREDGKQTVADSCLKACLTAQEISRRPVRASSLEGRDALRLVTWLYSTDKAPNAESLNRALYLVLSRFNFKTGEYYL